MTTDRLLGTQDKNKSMAEALKAMQDDVIAFVGAGGKTALMLKLANELFKSGFRVVITTTTKLGINERPEQSELVVEGVANKLISKLHTIQTQKKIPIVASGLDEENKRLVGISPKAAGRVASDIDVDYLLIEADGAQGKKFKIPMAHEPVVPKCVNKLCIVLGLDALGKRINEENCYNIEGMAALGGNPKEVLTPKLVRKLLFHPSGYLRFANDKRQIFLVLNKIDKLDSSFDIQDIAAELYHPAIDRIIVCSTKTPTSPPVKLMPDNSAHRISGIILAAGASSRFKGIKQCVDIGGKTLLSQVVIQALKSKLDEIILVLGYQKGKIIRSLGNLVGKNKLKIVENSKYKQGMSSSLKVGLKAAMEKADVDAVMIILGDQPKVTTELINEIIDTYKLSNGSICVPMIETPLLTRPGHPVIISQRLYSEVLKITGDKGAREVVKKNMSYAKTIMLSDDSSQFQINTEVDLNKFKGASR